MVVTNRVENTASTDIPDADTFVETAADNVVLIELNARYRCSVSL
jgi:hypothetical protein